MDRTTKLECTNTSSSTQKTNIFEDHSGRSNSAINFDEDSADESSKRSDGERWHLASNWCAKSAGRNHEPQKEFCVHLIRHHENL